MARDPFITIVVSFFSKVLKVNKNQTMVQVLGFIEANGVLFSCFLKNVKRQNYLNFHLQLIIIMYAQFFSHVIHFHMGCGHMFNKKLVAVNIFEM